MAKVKLGDVAREYKGTIKGNHTLPAVGLEHFTPGELVLEHWDVNADNTFTKGFRKGQVLFGRRRAYLKKAAVAPFDGVCSGDIIVIEADPEKINPKLLPFIIQNDVLFDYAVGHSAGSLSPRVKWEDLREFEFELPELDKQDELVELLRASLKTKKAYQRLVKAADDLVKSQFIEMFGDPVTNTQNREVKPFGFFMENIRYGTSQPPNFSEDGAFMFIRATNIKSGRIVDEGMLRISSDEASKIEKCKLQGGEIIIVRSGANTGDTCVIEEKYAGNYAGYDIIIKPNPRTADPVFFNELLNTHYMQQVIKPLTVRSAQPHINTQQVQAMPMLCVPIEDQKKFREFVEQSDKSKFVGENFKFKINNLAGRNQNVY